MPVCCKSSMESARVTRVRCKKAPGEVLTSLPRRHFQARHGRHYSCHESFTKGGVKRPYPSQLIERLEGASGSRPHEPQTRCHEVLDLHHHHSPPPLHIMAAHASAPPALQILDPHNGHSFAIPVKRINDGGDVDFFLASKAYAEIMTFIFQLNTSMLPRRATSREEGTASAQEWRLNNPRVSHSLTTQNLAKLLATLTAIIKEAPPDPGPRRFGNVSFRVWYDMIRERISGLLEEYLPEHVLAIKSTSDVSVKAELEAYLIGSFGSSQRLDYGTGHELSFLAFLGCLWKLGAFPESTDGDQERSLVLGVIEPYLTLIRRLILTYTLEPAGSHGVWGLDDHSFLPYIFGSAQFSPAITNPGDVAAEGSLPDAPNPADVAKANIVERERRRNMYFSAIGFIYDVKKGPFWEHSPILYDISGVKAGWAKINKASLS